MSHDSRDRRIRENGPADRAARAGVGFSVALKLDIDEIVDGAGNHA